MPPEAAPSNEERELARNRRTLYLMIGGATSLLLPLAGVLYLKIVDTPPARHDGPSLAFDHRGVDGTTGLKVSPAATPAPATDGAPLAQVPALAPRGDSPAPIQGGSGAPADDSLGFIRGGGDIYQDKTAAAAPSKPAAAPAPTPAPAPVAASASRPAAVARIRTRPQPKPFAMPHLKLMNTSGYSSFADHATGGAAGQNLSPQQIQALMAAQQQQQSGSSSGFGSMGGFGQQAAPAAQPAAAQAPAGGGSMTPQMAALLKNLPPGTDVSALLKNLPQSQHQSGQ